MQVYLQNRNPAILLRQNGEGHIARKPSERQSGDGKPPFTRRDAQALCQHRGNRVVGPACRREKEGAGGQGQDGDAIHAAQDVLETMRAAGLSRIVGGDDDMPLLAISCGGMTGTYTPLVFCTVAQFQVIRPERGGGRGP